ncbi:MAG: Nif3-like dinuclear metal center hexameric protein [Ignavibacteriales bacterium]|nr:Nif3-like dinuclear metal center hexameric protein [Ignavibacteriales bacterium]
MNLADVEIFFEEWTPRWTAWERDNVGIQIGRRSRKVANLLIALDATPEIIEEAVTRKTDLIVTHHPLLFRPPSSISDSDYVGAMVLSLAEKRIALFSAHTNLDSATGGVSYTLAQALGIAKPAFLVPLKDTLVKIVVFVPEQHVDAVAAAMASSGAGIIGEYQSCSFRMTGKGTFRGSAHSTPALGKPLRLEEVPEIRLEMMVPRPRVTAVVAAMKSAHPYEEVAYDLYTLENGNPNVGMGAIGELSKPMTLGAFLSRVKRTLRANSIRFSGSMSQTVKRVAVCGGSGSELLENAIRDKADVFVTADVRYHGFHSASGRIALVDAGHYETEHIVLNSIAERLRSWAKARNEKLVVTISKQSTNPIHSF